MIKKIQNIKIKSPLELITSIVSVVVFLVFAYYMYGAVHKNSIPKSSVVTHFARFNDIDGISIGSDIKLSGYKIGSVTEINIIPESYDVKVTFTMLDSISLPKDTTAAVRTSGLFGGKYLAILPGIEEEYLKNNEEIVYTQSSINLETLIGTFVNK